MIIHPDDGTTESVRLTTTAREEPLFAHVATHLQRLIVENRLKQGDRMPSERSLAEQFGISRTVIREAVRSLAAKGLLEVQAGNGASIQADPLAAVANSMSLLLSIGISTGHIDLTDVIEIRRLLEVESSSLAADCATLEDIALLEDILKEAERRIDDEDQFRSSDIAFHALLAKATHNTLLPVILGSISEALVECRREGWNSPGAAKSGLAQHRLVLDCVRDADSARARRAMNQHMDDALSSGALAIKQSTLS